MKKSVMKFGLASLAVGIGAFASPVNAVARIQNAEACSAEVLLSYFPEQFVSKTLESFKVPEAQRAAIQQELLDKNQEVIATVEERAGKMSPNPLRDPQHRQEAVKIFRDTLYDLFAQVLETHGINNKDQIQAMLDDIQQQKAKYFAKCIDKQQQEEPSQNVGAKQTFSRQSKTPNSDSSYRATIEDDYNEQY